MPKRKIEDKIERYQRKLKKLEGKRRKHTRILYSLLDTEVSDNEDTAIAESELSKPDDQIATTNQDEAGKAEEPVADLDPDILSALGETTEELPKFGPKIHDKLSRLWKKGINKEAKEKLVKEYSIPDNCTLLQAPRLNPEISAAISEGTRALDKRVESVQQQLGQGIAALNKGLELLLDDGKDRLQAIKFLSDSSRILCDLHDIETETRKKFITPGLDKSFLNIMQNEDRDELLFGNTLSEKIKATKVIEKHGLQKKVPQNPEILKWVLKGYLIPFYKKVSQRSVPRHSFSNSDNAEMSQAINKLLELGAISPCRRVKNDYLSSIFLADKSKGKKRFILNLKSLNNYISSTHFKMEDHRTAARLLPKAGFMANIDLKEAYLLVPIAKQHHKILK